MKKELARLISEYFVDFRAERAKYMNGHDEVAEILADGAERAGKIAKETMSSVREMIGIR